MLPGINPIGMGAGGSSTDQPQRQYGIAVHDRLHDGIARLFQKPKRVLSASFLVSAAWWDPISAAAPPTKGPFACRCSVYSAAAHVFHAHRNHHFTGWQRAFSCAMVNESMRPANSPWLVILVTRKPLRVPFAAAYGRQPGVAIVWL